MDFLFWIFINYGTLLAYIAFSTDLVVQIIRIYKRRSSKDVSAYGTFIRLTGSTVILLKFIGLRDPYLIIGQIIFTTTVATYLAVIIKYRNKGNQDNALRNNLIRKN